MGKGYVGGGKKDWLMRDGCVGGEEREGGWASIHLSTSFPKQLHLRVVMTNVDADFTMLVRIVVLLGFQVEPCQVAMDGSSLICQAICLTQLESMLVQPHRCLHFTSLEAFLSLPVQFVYTLQEKTASSVPLHK